jgi:putative flippase GtrA
MQVIEKFNTRVIRYGLSGLLSFAVENIAFNGFYYLINFSPRVSNILSVCAALVVNFIVSKYFVFKNDGKQIGQQLVQYIFLVTFNATFSTLLVGWLIDRHIAGYIAKFTATILIVSWNYLVYSRVIFKQASK